MPSKQSPSDSAVKPTDLDTTDSTSTSKRSPRHPCPPQRPTATVFEVMLGIGGTDALSVRVGGIAEQTHTAESTEPRTGFVCGYGAIGG